MNKNYDVIEPFDFYTQIGISETNEYYGNARISRGVFKKFSARPGDIVANGYPPVLETAGGRQISINKFSKPKDSSFERDYGYIPPEVMVENYMVKQGKLIETDTPVRIDIQRIRRLNETKLKPYMPSVMASERNKKMDLNRIACEVFKKAAAIEMEAPARVVTKQNQLMRSALALIKIFFGNEQDFREGTGKLKMLMSQGMTGIETTGMTPEQTEAAAEQVAKSIWVKFNNAIPADIQFRVAVMRQALTVIIKALFGVGKFQRNVFTMLDRKLGIDVEAIGYTGDAKDELFSSLYTALRQAIRAAAPAAVSKI